jgi:hypothetical protein
VAVAPSPPVTTVAIPPRALPAPDASSSGAVSDIGVRHLSAQEWRAEVERVVVERWKIERAELRFSPSQTLVAFVQSASRAAASRRAKAASVTRVTHSIVVVDAVGNLKNRLRPTQRPGHSEAPKDLQFLGEDRLAYEVLFSPPLASTKARGGRPRPMPVVAGDKPPRIYAIHPLDKRGRVLRCEGSRFVVSPARDRLAYVAGKPGEEFVAVDGAQVYPRGRGRTSIGSEPSWSKDGLALAFVEWRPEVSSRLVLLADVSNLTGDTTWDLPASAPPAALRVFWGGTQRLIVGQSMGRPMFATSFGVERR